MESLSIQRISSPKASNFEIAVQYINIYLSIYSDAISSYHLNEKKENKKQY